MDMTIKTADEYIAKQPATTQKLLKQLRQLIKKAAPQAEETLAYGMPAYRLNGPLLYIGGFKDHVSLFATKTPQAIFKDELKAYKTSAGTIQLPLDKPLPVELIKKIINFRVEENLAKKK